MSGEIQVNLTSTTVLAGGVYSGDTVTGAASMVDSKRLVSALAVGAIQESQLADAVSGAVLTIGGTLTGARTVTAPDASLTLAGQNYANVFTAAQTVRVAGGLTVQQASTQDAVALVGRAGGTSSYVASLTTGTLAASITLTLPVSTTTLGGLGITQSWTGTNTYTQQIISSLATGTAPLSVASTTVVANLNVSALLGSTWASPAAIGTGTPAAITGTTITANTGFVGGSFSGSTVTSSSLTSGRITTAGASGLLQDFSGLIATNISATATHPLAGANLGINATDGQSCVITTVSFGGGANLTNGIVGYACQGTGASPGATIAGDFVTMQLRGHDGSSYTALAGASVQLLANSTWSGSNREAYVQFRTCPNGSTSLTTAGRIDPNQTLVWGGGFMGSGTFSAGTQRPHIQTSSTTTANCNIAQVFWAANANGPTGIFAKSRSGTVGTQGVITTGDVAGTMSWQADDGTNFIEGARIRAITTGTIGTGQMSMQMTFATMNAAATMVTALTLSELQSVVVGNAGLATNATDGFLYIPSCAGTPTGVPTTFTNRLAIVYDRTNNKIYFYNGAWKATAALT